MCWAQSVDLRYPWICLRNRWIYSLRRNPWIFAQSMDYVERSSSVVECRTRNRESPGSNPPLLPFRRLGIFRSLHRRPCSLSCINEYLAIDSGGNVSDLVLAHNCCLARLLPGEAENGVRMNSTGLSGKAKSVKRFERSNRLDTALYKNYLFFLPLCVGCKSFHYSNPSLAQTYYIDRLATSTNLYNRRNRITDCRRRNSVEHSVTACSCRKITIIRHVRFVPG